MKLLVPLFLLFLLIYTLLLVQTEKEGGLTIQQWDKKCSNYFKQYPNATEKEFRMAGYCAKYVCVKTERDEVSISINECPITMINGKTCIPMHIRGPPFPECCRLKCYDDK